MARLDYTHIDGVINQSTSQPIGAIFGFFFDCNAIVCFYIKATFSLNSEVTSEQYPWWPSYIYLDICVYTGTRDSETPL